MQNNYTCFGTTNMPHTLYDTLKVSPAASRESIADAYKSLHSQLAVRISGIEGTDQDTLTRMEALREAFSTLSDPQRRRDYDRQLAAGRCAPREPEEKERPTLLKSVLVVGIIGLFVVGYAELLAELQAVRQEQGQIRAEAMMADLLLQKQREEQRLAAQADFQRRRDEAIERFFREQSENGLQSMGTGPSASARS